MFKLVKLILHFYNVKVTTLRCILKNDVINNMKFNSRRKGKKGEKLIKCITIIET